MFFRLVLSPLRPMLVGMVGNDDIYWLIENAADFLEMESGVPAGLSLSQVAVPYAVVCCSKDARFVTTVHLLALAQSRIGNYLQDFMDRAIVTDTPFVCTPHVQASPLVEVVSNNNNNNNNNNVLWKTWREGFAEYCRNFCKRQQQQQQPLEPLKKHRRKSPPVQTPERAAATAPDTVVLYFGGKAFPYNLQQQQQQETSTVKLPQKHLAIREPPPLLEPEPEPATFNILRHLLEK